jgi:hypothetical protein
MESGTNPLLFVTDVLNASPYPWQAEALKAIGEHDRVSIRAGHGVGKTTLEAWVVLWFMLTRREFKIPITANSQDQLRDVVWPELRQWHGKLPELLRDQIEITGERLHLKAAPQCFAVARTAAEHNTEALQGFHAKNLLFVLEEASGIADGIVEVAMGALSTPGAKQLMCGNPTKLSGYFYDSHHSLRHRWKTFRVSSEDVPAARGHIDDIIAKYGKDSNAYKIRVLGEFPTQEDETVIPLDTVLPAIGRNIEPNEAFRPVWGVDVARYGDDRTALAKRQGNTVSEPVKWWRGKDTMQVAGLVMDEYRFVEQTAKDLLPAEILVDVIGLGAGVVDRLNELGLPVRGVNVAESPAASERFMRLRDELWFRVRDWFRARECRIVRDEALISELTAPLYSFTSSGKILVEPKDELKKRGLRSPDLADAFILTFAGGLERREAHESDRYKRRHRTGRSWMTA